MIELKWMLSKIKQKLSSTIKEIANLSIQIKIATIVGLCVLVFIIITAIGFFHVRTVRFLYTKDTCISHISLLPDFFKYKNNTALQTINSDFTLVGGVKLFSGKTCFMQIDNPSVGSYVINTSLFFEWPTKPTFKIVVGSPPTINTKAIFSSPIITNKMLEIPISSPDELYDYTLSVENKDIKCTNSSTSINCDIDSLQLAMGKEYNIKLTRLFKNKTVAVIVNQVITTRSQFLILNTSVVDSQIIYDNPKDFVINFNKPISVSNINITKASDNSIVDTLVSNNGNKTTISVQKDLDRNTNYNLIIKSAIASDGSEITGLVDIKFKTSDGPTYLSSNIDSYGTALSKTITLTFDQPLSSEQNISDFITVGGISPTIWKTDNQVYIKYNNAAACSSISISIKSGIKSNYGFTQTKSWNITTRTLCQSVSIIGVTVKNKSIYAYSFGTGSQVILYTAALHGNEYSSKYLMEAWMDELEKNYQNIPSDKKIVVIPTINIDGNLLGSRYNTNGIDLNRNFPALDWKTDVYSLTNQLLPGGGGNIPLSEPESQALANYTKNINPKLVLSFHSSAGCVIANLAGSSTSLASSYSNLAGYRNATGASDTFSYPITGSFDDWLRDELNITSVLVELSTNSSSEFSRNRSALWAMANS